uniref:Uncharacterized protein n=1 Tax=Arundo donax TaxID=35708 RepID=A0A0A9FKZ5_ARUDO
MQLQLTVRWFCSWERGCALKIVPQLVCNYTYYIGNKLVRDIIPNSLKNS